jgi:DNA-binding CsgD family transcriptional regulator
MKSWWSELDDEVVHCLADGAIDPAEIGRRLGLPESAVTSLVTSLAREGRVRICLVAAAAPVENSAVHSFWCPFREQRVTAGFREDPLSHRRVAVNWCSAFSPATSIQCPRGCLGLDDLGEPAVVAA